MGQGKFGAKVQADYSTRSSGALVWGAVGV
jgi:hypothetical protein